MALLSDVTESVKRDRELRHSQAWLSTIVTGLTDYALVTLDGAGRILDWNASIQRVTGFESWRVEVLQRGNSRGEPRWTPKSNH